ncbi:MAG: response regulator [Spirochaetes bacterium]|nr:response regulator [Spirochaetota bacterium]MBU0955137.1 response regulator [Spirochaetota bacterium]
MPRKIFICEDETIVALDIQRFLKRNSYDVTGVFSRAEDLLAALETERPDLVLLDIHLAGAMDGLEAAGILYEKFSIPVILLTAYADSATIERAKKTQPYAYVLKPFNERELRTAMELALYRATMEALIKVSEQRYRSLFSFGLSPQCIINPDGLVLEANPAFLAMLGVQSFSGQVLDLFDSAEERKPVQESLQSGIELLNRELHPVVLDGSRKTVLVCLAPFFIEAGKQIFLFQAMDITEKQELSDKLVQTQKLDALGKLSSSVAHEFNNILTAILGFSRMLETEISDQPEAMAELEGIIRSTERASGLTRQLLMFARNDPLHAEYLQASEVCVEIEKLLSRLVGQMTRIVSSHEETDLCIYADKVRLQQAVMNLCINARDAMAAGGEIRIQSGVVHLDQVRKNRLRDIPAGAWVFISVRDQGEGIPDSLMTKIFEPFYTTKTAGKGTGLGLSTVLGIVQSASGYIGIESTPGSGSCFTVYLPPYPPRPPQDKIEA